MNRNKKKTAFKIEFFSKNVKVFTVTFEQFNASVVSKSSPLKKGQFRKLLYKSYMFGSILHKLCNQPSSLTMGSLDSRPALNVWMQRVCSGSTVVTSAVEYSRKMVRDVNMVTSSTPGSILSVQNNPLT